ncbi:MAG TPA: ABC transporter substrate-binding protein, partial [Streptosporangiaceae bacterium]|nr:ABC transporter substrate-binding protein [Streptosporangiaceae bacterium]
MVFFNRKTYIPLAAVAVAVTALAGCSSGGGGSSAKSASSGSVIKLGIITDVGTSVNDADEVAAARAAVRGVNKRGGIDGHQAELVFCNGNLSPVTDQSCTRQLINDKVMAFVGNEEVSYEESGDKL